MPTVETELLEQIAAEVRADPSTFALSDAGVQRKVAEKAAEVFATRWPDRVRSAYWVTVRSRERDQGFEVAILRKRVPLLGSVRLSGLIGRKSIGGAAFKDLKPMRINGRLIRASIGVGAVTRYGGGGWEPVIAGSIRF